jgi:hypothetical protein
MSRSDSVTAWVEPAARRQRRGNRFMSVGG